MKTISLILFLALVSIGVSFADTLVVPRNAQPNSGGAIILQSNGTTREYQELVPAVEFGALGKMEITQFAWRSRGGGINEDVLLPSLEIRLSTTTTTLSSLSPVISQNIGADQTTVFSGPYLLKSILENPNEAFNISFQFARSFQYNPKEGNLLAEVIITAPAGTPQSLPLSFGLLNEANGLGLAAEGFVAKSGPVTQFTFLSVPEPTPILLVVFGLCLLLKLKRK
jgi:hypothetical protein